MATSSLCRGLIMLSPQNLNRLASAVPGNGLHSTAVLDKTKAGKYKVTVNRSKPLTYEMAFRPNEIASHKGWNSFNTAQLDETFLRKEEMGQDLPHKMFVEDVFIRKFLHGTWPEMLLSEVLVKRQHNLIRIAAVTNRQGGNSPNSSKVLSNVSRPVSKSRV
jgi:hypothetical protein